MKANYILDNIADKRHEEDERLRNYLAGHSPSIENVKELRTLIDYSSKSVISSFLIQVLILFDEDKPREELIECITILKRSKDIGLENTKFFATLFDILNRADKYYPKIAHLINSTKNVILNLKSNSSGINWTTETDHLKRLDPALLKEHKKITDILPTNSQLMASLKDSHGNYLANKLHRNCRLAGFVE